jgi:hypothetical protein
MTSIFNAITETMAEQATREKAEQDKARASVQNIVGLADLWKFRTGHEQEHYHTAIHAAADARTKARIEERVARAERFMDAYSYILETIVEPSSGKPLHTGQATDATADWYVRGILTDAAKLDFFGMSFEQEFDLLEFVLTHENPLYIFEVVDYVLSNMFVPILQGKTAAEKQELFREMATHEFPEFLRLAIDAYMLSMAEQKKRLDVTEFGHDIVFETKTEDSPKSPDAPAPAEPGAPAETESVIILPNEQK